MGGYRSLSRHRSRGPADTSQRDAPLRDGARPCGCPLLPKRGKREEGMVRGWGGAEGKAPLPPALECRPPTAAGQAAATGNDLYKLCAIPGVSPQTHACGEFGTNSEAPEEGAERRDGRRAAEGLSTPPIPRSTSAWRHSLGPRRARRRARIARAAWPQGPSPRRVSLRPRPRPSSSRKRPARRRPPRRTASARPGTPTAAAAAPMRASGQR